MVGKRCRRNSALAALLVALGVTGCRREEITVIRVPKEPSRQPLTPGMGHAPAASPLQIRWQAPSDWQAQPASGMRLAQFILPGKDGRKVEVSVVALPGVAGKDVEVVNIFRQRARLPTAGEAELAGARQPVTIGPALGKLYDMAADDAALTNARPRLLVAVLEQGGSSWYFNLSGESAGVEEQKAPFLEFLRSVSFEAAPEQPPSGAATTATSSSSDAGGSNPRPAWDVPSGWRALPSTAMVLARFVAGSEDGNVEISVSAFPGDVGGVVANVNRWRGQIGLAPLTETDLEQQVRSLDVSSRQAIWVDMSGQKDGRSVRLIGAMVPQAGQTWFYKLLGDEAVAAREKAAFIRFVETVRYPHA